MSKTKPIDGASVLVIVKNADGEFKEVGEQTSLSRESTRNLIEADSKQHDHTKWVYGKMDDTVELEALYVEDDEGMKLIREAQKNKDYVYLRRSFDGEEIEEAEALIESISDEFPDNDTATVSVDFQLNEEWHSVSGSS